MPVTVSAFGSVRKLWLVSATWAYVYALWRVFMSLSAKNRHQVTVEEIANNQTMIAKLGGWKNLGERAERLSVPQRARLKALMLSYLHHREHGPLDAAKREAQLIADLVG